MPLNLARLLAETPSLRAPLAAVAALDLPDGWIGAGFVRNAAWQALHGRPADPLPGTDIDVVFHGTGDYAAEAAAEAALRRALPGPDWSVRDQARMHLRHGDAPYGSTSEAMRHWPETATAVAARLTPGGVELLAPFGLHDLLGLVLRPTPACAADPARLAAMRARVEGRFWLARWPMLRVATADAPAAPAASPASPASPRAGR